MSQQVIAATFDYSALAEEDRTDVREAAVRIKVRMTRTAEDIIEIGKELLVVKGRLRHGQFGPWLDGEFGMTDRTARNFMRVAQLLVGKTESLSDFTADALYELAAPSTDDEVVQAALDKAASGEEVSRDDIKKLKADLKEVRDELKAAKAANNDQVEVLRTDNERLRNERDDLAAEKSDSATRPVKKPDTPLNDFEVDDLARQRLVSAWNGATSETRSWFRDWIDTPVMDNARAG